MRVYNPRLTAINPENPEENAPYQRVNVNVETLTIDKQLQNTDAEIQDLTNPTSIQLNLFLPYQPGLYKSFLIVNELDSIGNFYLNNTIIYPGDSYEIIWQGSKWLEL